MARVFYRRMAIEYQKTVTLAVACARPENGDTVSKQLQRLHDLMFPDSEVTREARDEKMREIMKSEGEKSYRVKRAHLGERLARS